MTKVGRLFEEEKQEAVRQAVKEAAEKEKAQNTVAFVDNVSKAFHLTLEEACEKLSISTDIYEKAKKLLTSAASIAL